MSIIEEKVSWKKSVDKPTNKQEAQHLHSQHAALASSAQAKGDRVLFESHSQHAEYYLHLMNELEDHSWSMASTESKPSFKGSFLRRGRRKGGLQKKP